MIGRLLPVSLLTGCITMAGDRLADAAPKARGQRPSVEQTVGSFLFLIDGGGILTSNKVGRTLNDELLGRWQKSGFIAGHRYVPAKQFSDSSVYRITLEGRQDGHAPIALQIISGITLTLIPYYVDTTLDLRYSVENAETGCVFEAYAADSYNTVVGLLLLPATPFAQGGRTRTFDRIANHVYTQLAEQGAFDEHASCRKADAR